MKPPLHGVETPLCADVYTRDAWRDQLYQQGSPQPGPIGASLEKTERWCQPPC